MKAPLINAEAERLAALRRLDFLDTAPEQDFDDIIKLVAEICETPVSLISLVEDDRQWFKARTGVSMDETPIDQSMCAHVVYAGEFTEIEDTTKDLRTADNALVTGPDKVRFYAGALLRGDGGLPLGTLCVLDHVPRRLTPLQRNALQVLATQVQRQIELRRALRDADLLRKEVDHRVKNSLQSISAMIRMQMRGAENDEVKHALEVVQSRLGTVSALHEALYSTDAGAQVDLLPFLETVCGQMSEHLPRHLSMHLDVERCIVSSKHASAVGMIVNEAVTNAAKYAFAEGSKGKVQVLGRVSGGRYILTCQDDGLGMDSGHGGHGLGMRIMEAAAQQLGGEMRLLGNDAGVGIEVVWPLG